MNRLSWWLSAAVWCTLLGSASAQTPAQPPTLTTAEVAAIQGQFEVAQLKLPPGAKSISLGLQNFDITTMAVPARHGTVRLVVGLPFVSPHHLTECQGNGMPMYGHLNFQQKGAVPNSGSYHCVELKGNVHVTGLRRSNYVANYRTTPAATLPLNQWVPVYTWSHSVTPNQTWDQAKLDPSRQVVWWVYVSSRDGNARTPAIPTVTRAALQTMP